MPCWRDFLTDDRNRVERLARHMAGAFAVLECRSGGHDVRKALAALWFLPARHHGVVPYSQRQGNSAFSFFPSKCFCRY
jgi:hypothetical protein